MTSVILFTVFSVNPIQSAGILFFENFILILFQWLEMLVKFQTWVYRLRITASFKKTIPDKPVPVENDSRRLNRDHMYMYMYHSCFVRSLLAPNSLSYIFVVVLLLTCNLLFVYLFLSHFLFLRTVILL